MRETSITGRRHALRGREEGGIQTKLPPYTNYKGWNFQRLDVKGVIPLLLINTALAFA
jgi:hypothetical protein